MKKTTHINVNGQVFCIDEDAYASLQSYIETLEKHYLAEEDGKEIMADIESRIAELLRASLQSTHKEVISQTEVEQAIDIMGQPDIIIDEDREASGITRTTVKRKLYRDTEYAMLGGVASGLAVYLDISRVWVRLAFILFVFVFGSTAWVYLILWIVLPKAVTSRQKLEMRGERVNVSNIEKNIRDACREVTSNSKLRNLTIRAEQGIKTFFRTLEQILGRIAHVALIFMAVAGMLAGIFFLLAILWGIIAWSYYTPEEYQLFSEYIFGPAGSQGIKWLATGIGIIPFGILTYLSVSCLFGFRKNRGMVLLIAGGIWLACCFMALGIGTHYFFRYLYPYETTDTYSPEIFREKQEITVKFHALIADRKTTNDHMLTSRIDDYVLSNFKVPNPENRRLYIRPEIRFRKSEKSYPEIIIRKSVRGFSDTDGGKHLENIRYHHEWRQDTLVLDNFFTLHEPQWQLNNVSITILLPENYRINLVNTPPYWHPRRKDGKYVMQDGTLTRLL